MSNSEANAYSWMHSALKGPSSRSHHSMSESSPSAGHHKKKVAVQVTAEDIDNHCTGTPKTHWNILFSLISDEWNHLFESHYTGAKGNENHVSVGVVKLTHKQTWTLFILPIKLSKNIVYLLRVLWGWLLTHVFITLEIPLYTVYIRGHMLVL